MFTHRFTGKQLYVKISKNTNILDQYDFPEPFQRYRVILSHNNCKHNYFML